MPGNADSGRASFFGQPVPRGAGPVGFSVASSSSQLPEPAVGWRYDWTSVRAGVTCTPPMRIPKGIAPPPWKSQR